MNFDSQLACRCKDDCQRLSNLATEGHLPNLGSASDVFDQWDSVGQGLPGTWDK